jgi:hypothetical protein
MIVPVRVRSDSVGPLGSSFRRVNGVRRFLIQVWANMGEGC